MSYHLDFEYFHKNAESNAFHKSLSKLRCRSLNGLHQPAPTKREMKRMVERENRKNTNKCVIKNKKGF